MNIQKLTDATGSGTNEVREQKLIDIFDHAADIALDIGLDIAAVKHIAVGELSADKTGHGAEPDAAVYFVHVGRCVCLFSRFECSEINTERCRITVAVSLISEKQADREAGQSAAAVWLL